MTPATTPATSYVVAIDVGGTGMKGGLVTDDGEIALHRHRPTDRAAPVAGVRAFAAELAALGAAHFGHGPRAAGLAVPGLVEDGVARYSATLGWRDVPAAEFCDLDVPVALGHDVHAAGLAEAEHAPERDFLLLPIGTSIAGAMVLRGRPYASTLAGQIGHIPVWPDGEACPCGQRGCLAAYASAGAIAARYGTPGAAEVARAVAAGEPRAGAVWARAVEALALALATYTLILDPAAIVIGGGLARSGDLLLAPLRDRLAARLAFRDPPALRASALGTRAGVLGAAMLTRG
ncbi:glucokinase [Thermocatellispora tengchongensis]|uniref:Glucokinase n=1 Tax=Thermocatellispora tengchongensis TaxID=1073253 RepID=A0A840P9D7_9ACTN|nr:ROK family protein [Thermocatellispora tengchongensis]MBB5134461.1 glucokinase [Thermocatellispora tengchongensis]